nr:enzymatic polyprotein [Tanacetum cinerariifolium]
MENLEEQVETLTKLMTSLDIPTEANDEDAEKEEKELYDVLQNLTQNVKSRPESSTQKSTQASNSNSQQPSSPSPGRQEFMKREEDIEKVLHNSSHGKPQWYVIFNGPFRGIYTDWATASTHIIGKSVSRKSYLTKEAAEKALEESYKTIATEETQKSKQFVSLNQHLQSQTAKLNTFNRMKNIPTAKEKEEMRRPTVENFQRLLDSLMNYNEVHATMLFYPKKRRNIGPKAQRIDEVQLKVLSDFEDQIELFSGLLAPLPEDLKQQLCSYMSRNTRHHCYHCSEGTSSTPIMKG